MTAVQPREGSARASSNLDLGLIVLSIALLLYLPFHRWGTEDPAWFLIWLTPIPMALLAVEPMRRRTRLWAVWLAPAAGCMLCCHWLRYLAFAEVVVLGLYAGLYGSFAIGLIRLLAVRARLPLCLAVPVAVVAGETLRASLFGGITLFRLGEALVPCTTLTQIADLGGVPLLTFLTAFVGGAAAETIVRLRRGEPMRSVVRTRGAALPAVVAVLGVAAAWGYGRWRMADVAARTRTGPVLVTVQANIAQEVKNIPKDDEAYQQRCLQMIKGHLELAVPNARGADLVVWPETMFPWYLLYDTARGTYPDPAGTGPGTLGEPGWANLRDVLKMTGVPCLIGAAYVEPGPGAGDARWDPLAVTARNAAILAGPDGVLGPRYDKMHLVPFFETYPFYGRNETLDQLTAWIAGVRREPLTPGTGPVLMTAGGHRFGVSICYEIAFPWTQRENVLAGAGFVVNLSNDGWFQESEELDLMLDQAVLRAIETRVGVVRATNTGISAFIAPTGEIREVAQDPAGRRRRVPGFLRRAAEIGPGDSLYVRTGDVFSWAVTALAAVGSLLGFRRRSGTARD